MKKYILFSLIFLSIGIRGMKNTDFQDRLQDQLNVLATKKQESLSQEMIESLIQKEQELRRARRDLPAVDEAYLKKLEKRQNEQFLGTDIIFDSFTKLREFDGYFDLQGDLKSLMRRFFEYGTEEDVNQANKLVKKLLKSGKINLGKDVLIRLYNEISEQVGRHKGKIVDMIEYLQKKDQQ